MIELLVKAIFSIIISKKWIVIELLIKAIFSIIISKKWLMIELLIKIYLFYNNIEFAYDRITY